MIGKTLGLYISARFFRTIMAVFLTIFVLIYLIDFVELLRRSSDSEGASAPLVGFISLLRVPAVSEQVLPFAVLFGAMTAFLNLTRKLELVVARAAGVSAWQFLFPPIVIALLIGLVSITLYNPLSAIFKQRADRLETRLFGKTGRSDADTALWLRQRSIDGQAVLHAERSGDGGALISGISVFVFTVNGQFMERVEAARARLLPGFWEMSDARVTSAGEEPQALGTYLLATNLTPEQVATRFMAPETVPFWDLPELRDRTTRAGLDATGYSLQYQKLLARPLLLVAMTLVAASFSLRFFRFGGIAQMVSGGVGAGFVLYVASKLVADLGNAGLLSTGVAAWSPAIMGTMLGILAMLNQEDG